MMIFAVLGTTFLFGAIYAAAKTSPRYARSQAGRIRRIRGQTRVAEKTLNKRCNGEHGTPIRRNIR